MNYLVVSFIMIYFVPAFRKGVFLGLEIYTKYNEAKKD